MLTIVTVVRCVEQQFITIGGTTLPWLPKKKRAWTAQNYIVALIQEVEIPIKHVDFSPQISRETNQDGLINQPGCNGLRPIPWICRCLNQEFLTAPTNPLPLVVVSFCVFICDSKLWLNMEFTRWLLTCLLPRFWQVKLCFCWFLWFLLLPPLLTQCQQLSAHASLTLNCHLWQFKHIQPTRIEWTNRPQHIGYIPVVFVLPHSCWLPTPEFFMVGSTVVLHSFYGKTTIFRGLIPRMFR